jgi:hypothetical protein
MLASSFLQQKMRNIFVFGAVNRQRLPHDQQAGDARFAVFPPETWKGGVRSLEFTKLDNASDR